MTDQSTTIHVFDASPLLTYLHREPGWDQVRACLPQAVISSVNWSEVVQKTLARGVDTTGLASDLCALGLRIVPYATEDAEATAQLWVKTNSSGLSLGDRACLALGLQLNAPVWTSDRIWLRVNVGANIQLAR
jgi:PIN domain nuclease of toxin-antitoxin system